MPAAVIGTGPKYNGNRKPRCPSPTLQIQHRLKRQDETIFLLTVS